MNDRSLPPDLLQRFLDDRCTPQERQLVVDYLLATGREAELDFLMERVWDKVLADNPADALPDQFDAPFADFWARVIPPPASRRLPIWRQPAWRVAASLAVVCAAALAAWLLVSRPEKPLTWLEERNGTGERSELTLPDGTRVWLNAASRLRYPREFTGPTRPIQLEGEAFFEVYRDTTRPFVVTSGTVLTRVLGTRFNVKAYRDDANTEVTVAEGKVRVTVTPTASNSPSGGTVPAQSTAEPAVVLVASGRVVVERASGQMRQGAAERVADYTAWRSGRVVFNATPMADVIRQLRRSYGVNIRLSNPALTHCLITAEVRKQSLADVMTAICVSVRAKYALKGREVTITGKGCD